MWNLYLVHSPVGSFIGVAKSPEHAAEHFGTLSTITELSEKMVLELRADGPDRVFLAI